MGSGAAGRGIAHQAGAEVKRTHILRWLSRYGDDPQYVVHARVAREWLRRHGINQGQNP